MKMRPTLFSCERRLCENIISLFCVRPSCLVQSLIGVRNTPNLNKSIESDCQRVIFRLLLPSSDNSYFSILIEDCLNLRVHFDDISFAHVPRNANSVAHGLAKLAQCSEFFFPSFWLDDVYPNIYPLIVNDIQPQ